MPMNLRHLVLPSGWDAGELSRISLADGTDFETLTRDLDDALQLAADELLNNTYVGRLIHVTDQPAVEYDAAGSEGFTRRTDRGMGDGRKPQTGGHMLPLVEYDHPLFWTYSFLKGARRAQLERHVSNLINNAISRVQVDVFTRLFKLEEETGEAFGLGTAGYSVPFVDGGNGAIAYTPPPFPERGGIFQATHNHFLRLDGITQNHLETAVTHLWEHGYNPPFDCVISLADIADWQNTTNVTGFVERPDPDVAYGSGETLANIDDVYIGGVKTKHGFVRLYATGRVPTNYWCVTKVFGPNDPMNPIRVRTPNGLIVPQIITEQTGVFPLQGAVPIMEIGAGVGESRVAAVCVENDSTGSYGSPTIS